MNKERQKPVMIGRAENIDISGHAYAVPAKVDTGADSSSIWASDVRIDSDNMLHFQLFGDGSQFHTGEVISRKDYDVVRVTSSNGQSQIRYRTHLSIVVCGRKMRVLFTLSDRSRNKFPILIGRRTISGKFLVDVTKGITVESAPRGSGSLSQELANNPHEFFKKYNKSESK